MRSTISGAAYLSGEGRWQRSPPMPVLRQWPAVAQDRQIRRFYRLLELSRMPLHRPDLASEAAEKETVPAEGIELGIDPETGETVTRHEGRFGPYVQLGKGSDDEKPRRASIPKGQDPASNRSGNWR